MPEVTSLLMMAGLLSVVLVVVTVAVSVMFRRVVSTNMVHIVQSRRQTQPYGTGQAGHNVYYRWPSWVPYFGVTVIALPVSNFDLSLHGYEAYDKDRVPFMVDVVAFFRINDTAIAAQRVTNVEELKAQLTQIVQGAVRKVLASALIDTIMLERAQFGQQFTDEVAEQLKEWGTEPVKSMELMDIRDSHDSKVISNIMAKKTSHISMESRVEVARNKKTAENAEIEADQQIAVRKQESEEEVAKRTAAKDKAVGIAQQQSRQEVLMQEKVTQERDMDVRRVQQVKAAEIKKDESIVVAEQGKQTTIIAADGALEAKRKEATGVQVLGEAKAAAEKAMQLAPVEAQIVLAKEIGTNDGYQNYLIGIESVRAYIQVGVQQAEALKHADVKVIANNGSATSGMRNVMDLFSSKGGTELAAAVEAFAQSPVGQSILGNLGVGSSHGPAKPNGKDPDSPSPLLRGV